MYSEQQTMYTLNILLYESIPCSTIYSGFSSNKSIATVDGTGCKRKVETLILKYCIQGIFKFTNSQVKLTVISFKEILTMI